MLQIKMVLIISTESDHSTNDVISWLTKKKIVWFRLNKEDVVYVEFIDNSFSLSVGKQIISLTDISFVWHRKGSVSFLFFSKKTILEANTSYRNHFAFLSTESSKLKEYFYYLLNKKPHLNTYAKGDVNKLIAIDVAKNIGLKTPNSFVLSTKESYTQFCANKTIITKTISGNPHIVVNDKQGIMYTTLIKKVENANFFPSLFQEYIPKKYELRIFYIDNTFFTMCIFSQKEQQTRIDFRQYKRDKPNRTVPYKLPNSIKLMLHRLMEKLELESGSIDMIVSLQNEYYFLEVNPVGQFGMVSYPCNYNIEKEIANYIDKKRL